MKTLFELEYEDDLTFGKVLRAIREARYFDQRDFAELLVVSESTLSRWENDEVPDGLDASELERIRRLGNMSEDELFALVRALGCTLLRQRGIFV